MQNIQNDSMVKIDITDDFWVRYIELIKDEMIPYQWNVLNDVEKIEIEKERNDASIPSEKSHAMANLKIAAGLQKGNHYGWLFQDSDVYKWIESAANSLKINFDDKLKGLIDEVVDIIDLAQDEDGYLSTFYQIEAPELKFKRLFESHELYSAGHLIEAAVAYYRATKEDKLLKVATKLVECIENNFGPEEGKIHGADGHQEVEIALVKLYEITGEKRYLELSRYFIEVRGQDPFFYQKQIEENSRLGLKKGTIPEINPVYHQAHQPIEEQQDAVGHAVRLVYMAAAMADIAYYTSDKTLFSASKRLWKSIVEKRLFVTGGIGSTVNGEAFTFDYDLPNDTMYCETCAAIGLMNFANNMLKNESDASYSNILERCLYNSVISGMSLDGKHFFYVNPLEVDPKASRLDPGKSHVKPSRPSWFGCACCPPNLARTLTSLDKYIYTQKKDVILINLMMNNNAEISFKENHLKIKQQTKLPIKGEITILFELEGESTQVIGIRIPEWAGNYFLKINNDELSYSIENGYAYFDINEGQTNVNISFEMPVLQISSHPKVKNNRGKVTLQRGPYIYCLEEEDNGTNLHLVHLTGTGEIKEVNIVDDTLGNIIILEAEGEKEQISPEWINQLYRRYEKPVYEKKLLKFIPYYSWANRSIGEMQVWVTKKE